jgi:hypothetical protein
VKRNISVTIYRKVVSGVILMLFLTFLGVGYVSAADNDIVVLSEETGWNFRGRYDGVDVYCKVLYYMYNYFDVYWRFENNNNFPVRISVSDKLYETNYGSYHIEDFHKSYADLEPFETKGPLSPDRLYYKWFKEMQGRHHDSKGSIIDPLTVTEVHFEWSVRQR